MFTPSLTKGDPLVYRVHWDLGDSSWAESLHGALELWDIREQSCKNLNPLWALMNIKRQKHVWVTANCFLASILLKAERWIQSIHREKNYVCIEK